MQEGALEGKGYIWHNFTPDTFKGACRYLMAHKEPYERVVPEIIPPARGVVNVFS